MIGIMVTPALYAWFNIVAFWDPYSHTGNIEVAVVNLDEGATSELTGDVDVGAELTGQLEENHQLGWTFMSTEEEALHAVRSGEAYAAVIIPADFSKDLLSITTGTFTQPKLRYYVDEKANAVAPKITDAGVSELERRVTSAFVERVAQAATTVLKDTGVDIEEQLTQAQERAVSAFDSALDAIASTDAKVADLAAGLNGARDSLDSARGTLGEVSGTLGDVRTALAQAQSIIEDAQRDVLAFTDSVTTAYVDGATQLAEAAARVQVKGAEISRALGQVSTAVEGAINVVTDVAEANGEAIAQLQALLQDSGLDPEVAPTINEIVSALQERNQTDQQLLGDLATLNNDTASAVAALEATTDAVAEAAAQAQAAAGDMRSVMAEAVPALSTSMAALQASAGTFSAALEAQEGLLAQAEDLLGSLDDSLVATASGLESLEGNLGGIMDSLTQARTDVRALSAAADLQVLTQVTGLDPDQIAAFMAEPVGVTETVLFPINSYGSGMAALFTNLSLWIGAFVLMVIFRTEVDTEGVEGITVREAYLGRFWLFAAIAVLQAIVVCVGNLVIGVQTVNAVAFVATAVAIALAYVSIVYAVCVSFGHVGRGLCIVLVIMQIPGASGLYPIELMPGFFRGIYPLLPFTYGIDAMRETIGGFYGNHYWGYLGALALFVLAAFVIGLALRDWLSHVNLVLNRDIVETELLLGERVQVTGTRYRLADVLRALAGRGEFREAIARRGRRITTHYRRNVRIAVFTGFAGLVVIGVIAWLTPGGKASLLGIWVAWCLVVIGYLIAAEYARRSFEIAQEVAGLDEAELQEVARGRALVPAGVGAPAHAHARAGGRHALEDADESAYRGPLLPYRSEDEAEEPEASGGSGTGDAREVSDGDGTDELDIFGPQHTDEGGDGR